MIEEPGLGAKVGWLAGRVILALSTAWALSDAAEAQSRESSGHEHAFFECRDDGLARGQRVGCQLVASPQ